MSKPMCVFMILMSFSALHHNVAEPAYCADLTYYLPSVSFQEPSRPTDISISNQLNLIESTIRHSQSTEPFYYPRVYTSGLESLIYPIPSRLGAPWEYIKLGDAFHKSGDYGGASISYWSTLVLAQKTFASRPDKEAIRRSAYNGLANVAKSKGQAKWSELMGYCVSLCDTYLESVKAMKDKLSFYIPIKQIKTQYIEIQKQKEQIEAERVRQDNAQRRAIIGAVLNVGTSILQVRENGGIRNQEFLNQTVQSNIDNAFDLQQRISESNAAYETAKSIIDTTESDFAKTYEKFSDYVADDVTEIEAGNSFIVRETVTFLASADDIWPYINVIAEFAKGKPTISKAIDQFYDEGVDRVTALQELAKSLQAYEIQVVMEERHVKALR